MVYHDYSRYIDWVYPENSFVGLPLEPSLLRRFLLPDAPRPIGALTPDENRNPCDDHERESLDSETAEFSLSPLTFFPYTFMMRPRRALKKSFQMKTFLDFKSELQHMPFQRTK